VTLLLFLDGKMGFEGTRILQLFREIAREMTDGGVIEIGVVSGGEFFKIGGGEGDKFQHTATNRHLTTV